LPVTHKLTILPIGCQSAVSHPADWLSSLPTHQHAIIVGAGPNGRPHHSPEPTDCLKIACNSAILLPWRFDIYMVFDLNARNFPWFKTPTTAHKVFGHDIGRFEKADVVFQYMPTINSVDELTYGILHGGATIAGCALQLCYWLNCAHVTLLGIDQYGDKHFDGTIGAPKHFGRKWTTVKPMEKIIRYVTARGMAVDSLSKTELSVPRVKHL
jgi:hypothetical protein